MAVVVLGEGVVSKWADVGQRVEHHVHVVTGLDVVQNNNAWKKRELFMVITDRQGQSIIKNILYIRSLETC